MHKVLIFAVFCLVCLSIGMAIGNTIQVRKLSGQINALYSFYEVSIDLAKQADEYNQKVIDYNQQVVANQKQQIVK